MPDATNPSLPEPRIIVAGFGPVGRAVADQLARTGAQVVVVDLNPKTCDSLKQRGHRAVHGDVTDEATLRDAGIADAEALVLAVPDENQALRACEVARRLAPDIFIAARTNFLSKGMLASQAGADHVVVEEVVTAEAMSKAVAERLSSQS